MRLASSPSRAPVVHASDERNASDGPNKGNTHYNNKGFSGRSVLQGFGNNNSNFQKSTSKSLTKVFVCLKTELDGVFLIVFFVSVGLNPA